MNLKKLVLVGLMIVSPVIFAKSSKQMQMPPTVVNTSVVQQKDWQQTIQTTGSLAAFEGIQIAPEIEGRVIGILFHSGQMVKKGDVLVQLDDDVLKAKLKKAQSQLELNQSNYERFSKLYEKGFFSVEEIGNATMEDLMQIRGIGEERATQLIEAAQIAIKNAEAINETDDTDQAVESDVDATENDVEEKEEILEDQKEPSSEV